MTRSFARRLTATPYHRGTGACIPCGSAGTPEEDSQARSLFVGTFVASTIVGVVGFAVSSFAASTIATGGVILSLLGLAALPTPEK